MDRLLITGGTGFVGREILLEAAKKGFEITLVCREMPEPGLRELTSNFVFSDDLFAENQAWWRRHLEGIDAVIHAAWYVRPGDYLNNTLQLKCLQGSIEMGLATLNSGVKSFIGLGTCFEYDVSEELLEVGTPLKANSLYSACKISLFTTLERLFSGSSVQFIWPRLFYLFGERDSSDRLYGYVMQQIKNGEDVYLGDGGKIRDYMCVRDAASEITDLLFSDMNGAINICNGYGITIRSFVEDIVAQHESQSKIFFNSRPSNSVDPDKIIGVKS